MDLEQVVAGLVQRIEQRFYGKYRGFVVDNADPERLGRLRLLVPSVLGQDVVTGWALPCVPYGGAADRGMVFIPEVDAGVWVEFEEGDLEFPIWVGTFWSKPGGESELPKANDAVQDPPTQKIIKTQSGHTIQLEDAEGEEKIVIKHKGNSFVSIDKDGSVIIGNQKGSTLILDAKQENVLLVEQHGHTVAMTAEQIVVAHKEGGVVIELSSDKARVIANKIELQGTSVILGRADVPVELEPTIKGKTFAMLWNTFIFHTHPTALGPSGPPLPPSSPLAPKVHLTSSVTVK